jgi:hypothetical protein
MNPLFPITREELARALDRARHGEDLNRRQPSRPLVEYFQERKLQTARARELLARRMTDDPRRR